MENELCPQSWAQRRADARHRASPQCIGHTLRRRGQQHAWPNDDGPHGLAIRRISESMSEPHPPTATLSRGGPQRRMAPRVHACAHAGSTNECNREVAHAARHHRALAAPASAASLNVLELVPHTGCAITHMAEPHLWVSAHLDAPPATASE